MAFDTVFEKQRVLVFLRIKKEINPCGAKWNCI